MSLYNTATALLVYTVGLAASALLLAVELTFGTMLLGGGARGKGRPGVGVKMTDRDE